jgi:hypothetical protein
MQGCGIIGWIDRHTGEARLPCSTRDADGDLAAIGDQKLLEGHGRSVRTALPIVESRTMREDIANRTECQRDRSIGKPPCALRD